MSLLTSVIGAVAGQLPPPVPVIARIEAQIVEQDGTLASLKAQVSECSFQAVVAPSVETDAELARVQAAYDLALGRREQLQSALGVAMERAASTAERALRAEHDRNVKALAARLTTVTRKGKALSARLAQANVEWTTLLREVEEVTKLWPKASGVRMPHQEATGLATLQQMVKTEIARLICVADPVAFTRIGSSHRNLLGVRDGADGHIPGFRRLKGADTLPSLEARLQQAADSLVSVARANPPPARPVTVSVPRLPSVVPEPGQLEALKAQHAEHQAEMTSPEPWTDAGDIESQKREWAGLQHPADRIDPDTYDEGEPAETALLPLHELTAPELKETTDVE